MENLPWLELFPQSSLLTLPQITSDHAPVLLDTLNKQDFPKSFKFKKF